MNTGQCTQKFERRSNGGRLRFALGLSLTLATGFGLHQNAEARLTRITAGPATTVNFPSFGATGPYLKISGTFQGELDPADPKNAIIADIGLAPTVGGKVQYSATFFILRPVDLSKGNGKLFYDFGNRGSLGILNELNDANSSNDPTVATDFGNGFLMRQGYIIAASGWAGDVPPGPGVMSITLPAAKNPDGTSITGMVVAEAIPTSTTQTTIGLGSGGGGGIEYATNSMTPDNGTLTVRELQTDPKVPVPGWSWVTPTPPNVAQISFPGPAKVNWIYEFIYQAKDPTVMGIGHAANRDFISFLRSAAQDDFGNPNPVAMPGGIQRVYSTGVSQGGRVQVDMVYYGFNQDENGKKVIDGMMPRATGSGGLMWMNFRFSQPTVSAQQHSRHHSHEPEFPHTFHVMTDPLTGQTDGFLRRCLASNTCPNIFNVDGSNEYWMKSSSLHHTDASGNDLNVDTLSPNVRLYDIASMQHAGAQSNNVPTLTTCQQMSNPLDPGPVLRALAVALDQWVSQGIPPPPSMVPTQKAGTLVAAKSINFPKIPATHYGGWGPLPPVEFHPESVNYNAVMDFSVVPPADVPGKLYTVLVSAEDTDGNETAGIRLPQLQVPLGTYEGWNWYPPGMADPDRCSQLIGTFVPFANTAAERIAAGDPRPSIEERYGGLMGYYYSLVYATENMVPQRFILPEDEEALLNSGLQKWLSNPALPHW